MPKSLLFLCTGNYYRSRFAEIVFNDLAKRHGVDWRADSRGLARKFFAGNIGPISPLALVELAKRDLHCPTPIRNAMRCYEDDLSRADHVVALKEAEHRPMLASIFPGWEERVEYWHVHDLDAATPVQAMGEIEELVHQLVERIRKMTWRWSRGLRSASAEIWRSCSRRTSMTW